MQRRSQRDDFASMTVDDKLVTAIYEGSMRDAVRLLHDGAKVDGLPELPFRPLIGAARFGRVEHIRLLLKRGADVEVPSSTVIQVDDKRQKLVLGIGYRPLHAASFGGQVEAIRMLLEAGADPNAVCESGKTALMVACGQPSLAKRRLMVRALIKAGADPAKRDSFGSSALHNAAIMGHPDVFAMLLSKAPTLTSAADNVGFTPLGYATLGGHGEAVSYLMSVGASDHAVLLEKKKSSLHAAVQGGHVNIVRMFLDGGLEAVGGLGVVPRAIANAIQCKQMKILPMLLLVEGDDKQKDWANTGLQDASALHWATLHRSFVAMQILLAAGADLATETLEGFTARDLVVEVVPGKELEDPDKETAMQAALRRLLDRAPACRARSWAWPAGCLGNLGGTTDLVVWSRRPTASPLGVSIFRPTSGRFFATRFSRCVCAWSFGSWNKWCILRYVMLFGLVFAVTSLPFQILSTRPTIKYKAGSGQLTADVYPYQVFKLLGCLYVRMPSVCNVCLALYTVIVWGVIISTVNMHPCEFAASPCKPDFFFVAVLARFGGPGTPKSSMRATRGWSHASRTCLEIGHRRAFTRLCFF